MKELTQKQCCEEGLKFLASDDFVPTSLILDKMLALGNQSEYGVPLPYPEYYNLIRDYGKTNIDSIITKTSLYYKK